MCVSNKCKFKSKKKNRTFSWLAKTGISCRKSWFVHLYWSVFQFQQNFNFNVCLVIVHGARCKRKTETQIQTNDNRINEKELKIIKKTQSKNVNWRETKKNGRRKWNGRKIRWTIRRKERTTTATVSSRVRFQISKFNCVYASIPIEGMCVQYRERMGKNNYTRNQNLIWWNWMKFAFALIENNIMSWVELIWFDLSHAQAPFLRHIYYFTYYSIELASIICDFFFVFT